MDPRSEFSSIVSGNRDGENEDEIDGTVVDDLMMSDDKGVGEAEEPGKRVGNTSLSTARFEGSCEIDGNEEGIEDDIELLREGKPSFILGVGKADWENESNVSGEDAVGVSVNWVDDPAGENVSCDAAGVTDAVVTIAGAGGVTVLTGATVEIGVTDTGRENVVLEVGTSKSEGIYEGELDVMGS